MMIHANETYRLTQDVENVAVSPLARKWSKPKKRRGPKLPKGFYDSKPWLELRAQVLRIYGRRCMCCKTEAGEMHVDHIVPRSKDRSLELEITNLQVLCRVCNMGKGTDTIDYRPKWRAPDGKPWDWRDGR